jgi:hypothetical protein
MEVNDHLHAIADLAPGKEPEYHYIRARWSPGSVWTPWRTEKSLAPGGNRTPTVQPVVSRYTNQAIQSKFNRYEYLKYHTVI